MIEIATTCYKDQQRSVPRLLPPGSQSALALVLAGVLVAVMPNRDEIKHQLTGHKVNLMSLTYLELALDETPDDDDLRLVLARHYYRLGRYHAALQALAPLTDASRAHALRSDVVRALCTARVAAPIAAALGPAYPCSVDRTRVITTADHVRDATVTSTPAAARPVRALRHQPTLAQRLAAALARGDVARALPLARAQVRLTPTSRRARLALARIAGWAGRPLIAMDQWAWLARHHGGDDDYQRALALARANWDQALIVELMTLRAGRRGLTADERLALARLHLELGQPDLARAVIAAHLDADPDHRPSWDLLREIAMATADIDAALRVWTDIDARFGTTAEEAITRAELLWRARRPDDALAVLARAGHVAESARAGHVAESAHERLSRIDGLRLAGEIAWHTERYRAARAAYQRLWRLGALRAHEAERLVTLARSDGDIDVALAAARAAWRRAGEPRLLLLAMFTAVDARRWDQLAELLALADNRSHEFERNADYWRLRAALRHHRLGDALARDQLERANDLARALDRDLDRAAAQGLADDPGLRALRADVNRQALLIALQRGDRSAAQRALDAPGISAADRVDALRRLAAQVRHLTARLPRRVSGAAFAGDIGGLTVLGARAAFAFTGDDYGVTTQVAGAMMQPAGQRAPRLDEAMIELTGARRTRRSVTQVSVGGILRNTDATSDLVPQVGVAHQRRVATDAIPGLVVTVQAGVNRVTEETGRLRASATRDDAAVSLAADVTERVFVSGRLTGQRYRERAPDRAPETLGVGIDAELSAGYRVMRGATSWNLRVLGVAAPRSGGPHPAMDRHTGPRLPHSARALAVATTVSRVPDASRAARYAVELSSGWDISGGGAIYAASARVGIPLAGRDEVAVSAQVSNALSLALPIASGSARSRAMITYTRSLWP